MRERDITTAYVASCVWVLSRYGRPAAVEMRSDVLSEALGGDGEEWDAACDELAEYARRQGEGRRAAQFESMKIGGE